MQAIRCLAGGGGIKIRYLNLETFRGYSRKVLSLHCRWFGPKVSMAAQEEKTIGLAVAMR